MAHELEKDVEPAILETPFRPLRSGRGHSRVSEFYPPSPRSPWQKIYLALRFSLEWLGALALVIVTGPVMLAAALAIKLSSRGPAFYTQTRIGRDGRPFTIFKLRTMIHQCESLTGPRWCIPGDPRITPLGYFLRLTHIDELPQLFNVLLGHMSLIGPRPERPEFVVQLEKAIPGYRWREKLKPGITGLAQVQLPPHTEVEEVKKKVAYDLFYLRNFGFWLDVKILGATLTRLFGFSFARSRRVWGLPGRRRVAEQTMTPKVEARSWTVRQAA
jgi:lipopolysaccharide/colanic/teichoic acid biosynthesis glycosyltransferase